MRVQRANGRLHGVDVMTEPFPGFPTDLQAQYMALMTTRRGRLDDHRDDLRESLHACAGAGPHGRQRSTSTAPPARALVRGVPKLSAWCWRLAAREMATDLRASVSLVRSRALAAEGDAGDESCCRVYRLDRGFERFSSEKLGDAAPAPPPISTRANPGQRSGARATRWTSPRRRAKGRPAGSPSGIRERPCPVTAAAELPANEKLVLALPKGRILKELAPLLRRAGVRPEPAFDDEDARQLRFATDDPGLDIIRVRSFDVATFVAFGAAHLGVAGNDVLMEFDYPEIYAPVDLGIGRCRISVAEPVELSAEDDPSRWSHVRVATKYPKSPAATSPPAACRPSASS
jgi:hypothetical protein